MPLISHDIAGEVLQSVGLVESSSSQLTHRDDPIFPIMENSGADLLTLVLTMVRLMNTAKNSGTRAKVAMKLLEIHGYPGRTEEEHGTKINIVINNGNDKVANIFNPQRKGI